MASAGGSIVAAVRAFVEAEVAPAAPGLEHADRYPYALVERLRELGLFGALVPRAWGGLGLDVATYARVIEELCRGWMSLAGVVNSHTMMALIVLEHGTEAQRARFLPRFASGALRGGLCLTEPHAGSDVQAIRTRARPHGDAWVLDGSKMFVTNGREGNAFALLAVTDPGASPPHRGMSCFIVEKGHAGFQVVKSIAKLGYKGVDTAELLFEACPVPAANLVGGVAGRGFRHVMSGLEAGRINIAARAVGVGQAALEAVLAVARRAGGAPPLALAGMAARLEGARQLTYWAAARKDRGERTDLEAGMAKLWASETGQALAGEALRSGGAPAVLASAVTERLYRDTPLMLIGEGTNEIQRTLIARQLLARDGQLPGDEGAPGGPDALERRQMVLAVRQLVTRRLAADAHHAEPDTGWPGEAVEELEDLGVLGATLPGADGGLELDPETCALLVAEVGRGSATVAAALALHLAACHAIARTDGREAREVAELRARARWLARFRRGGAWATVAVGGRARLAPDGEGWRLDGHLPLVENAARARLIVVEAQLGDGLGLALVPTDSAGVTLGLPDPPLGLRGLDPRSITLAGVRLERHEVLDGAWALGGMLRLLLAAASVGLAEAAVAAALRYARERSAFGKPIGEHQAVQLLLADAATATAAARVLTAAAGRALADGSATPAGLARLLAAETAVRVTLDAMRVHGGYGYTAEFTVERCYRDAPRLLLALGDLEAEQRRLGAALLGPERPLLD